jgi:WG containing repeat
MRKFICIVSIFVFQENIVTAQKRLLLIPYRNGNQWGYCDSLGNIKIKTEYDSACYFKTSKIEQVAQIYKNKKTGIIDNKGNILVPIKFSWITTQTMDNHAFWFGTEESIFKRGLYINNKEILPPIYQKIFERKGNCFVVKLDGKCGLFNAKGKLVIPINYKYIDFLKQENQILYYEAVNNLGTQIFKDTIANYLPIKNDNEDYQIMQRVPDFYKIQLHLDSIKKFYSFDTITYIQDEFTFCLQKGKLKGFWISDLNKIVLPQYDDIKFSIPINKLIQKKYNAKYLIAVLKNGKYGIVNEDGKIIYPFEFDNLRLFENTITLEKGEKKGITVIDNLNSDIKIKYDAIKKQYFENVYNTNFNVFIVELQKRMGFVGENGIEYFKD